MENTHPHENHRARLRRRYLLEGLFHFEPHNVLELLLFYAIPRRDTNETAHALLSRFGDIDGVLAADEAALCGVSGVGGRTAAFLSAFSEVSLLCEKAKKESKRYHRVGDIGRLCAERFREVAEDAVLLLFFNQKQELIGEELIEGNLHSASFSPHTVSAHALLSGASHCAVAHNHKDAPALPKAEDFDITRILAESLTAVGVPLLEHFLIAGDRFSTILYRYSGGTPQQAPFFDRVNEEKADLSSPEEEALASLLRFTGEEEAAARLLSAFGHLRSVCTAGVGALIRKGRLKQASAILLSLVASVGSYRASRAPAPSPTDKAAIGQYLCRLYRFERDEVLRLVFFDKNGRMLSLATLSVGSLNEAGISCRRIAEDAFFAGAHTAYLAHNHPNGDATPSLEDHSATELARAALSGVGVSLLGHYVITADDYRLLD